MVVDEDVVVDELVDVDEDVVVLDDVVVVVVGAVEHGDAARAVPALASLTGAAVNVGIAVGHAVAWILACSQSTHAAFD